MPDKFTDLVTRNWPAKIISVAFAILLFLFYRAASLEERFFSVPLDIRINESYAIASEVPSSVKVMLRGSEESVFTILENDIDVYADFTEHSSEEQFRSVLKYSKRGSALNIEDLEIKIDPPEITLELEKRISRSVKIQPVLAGYPDKGYELDQYILSTEEAVVEGPASHVEQLENIETEVINLDGRQKDFYVRVKLNVQDPYLSFPAGNSIGFQGVITETVIMKTFEDIDLIYLDLPLDLNIDNSGLKGNIKVQGKQMLIEKTTSENYALTADCSEIDKPGEYIVNVRPIVPSGVIVLRYTPETLILRVKKAK
ncbi:MAG: CdaR family protein [Spirochaetales bacterium]|nr:CdaR family protein [Spirochaetales bacterium]